MTPLPTVLSRYPKVRPPLPESVRSIKEAEHRLNRSGGDAAAAASKRLEGWMHREVATSARPGQAILEIGAGILNHLPFETEARAYDVIEPAHALCEESPHRPKVRDAYRDIREIPADRRYDRVISIAVLEHLTDLPEVLARGALMLEPGGRFHHGIPSEGGLLWGLAWRSTTGVLYRIRTGQSRKHVMRHEHVNDAAEVAAVVRWLFDRVEVRRYPALGPHLSFYTVLSADHPRLEACRQVIDVFNTRNGPD